MRLYNGKETVLYSFSGPDGSLPYAGLIRDSAGNFYGTTVAGGASGLGTIFKLDPVGHETVLHSFGGADGQLPYASVIADSAGNRTPANQFGGQTGTWPRKATGRRGGRGGLRHLFGRTRNGRKL